MSIQSHPSFNLLDSKEFAAKTVVITGAGSGKGRATALAFAKQEARLALLDIFPNGLHETMDSMKGDDHFLLKCDLAQTAASASAFAHIDRVYSPIDVLVNNAGINPPFGSSLDVDEAYFDRVMGVNVKALCFCAQAAMKSMIPRASGVIVSIRFRHDWLGRERCVVLFERSGLGAHQGVGN